MFSRYSLFANVAALGGVMGTRRARELGGQSRAKGYGDRTEEEEDEEEDEDEDEDEGEDMLEQDRQFDLCFGRG